MKGNYWLLVDPETRNPVEPASICWAYYPGDKPKPVEGLLWIEVRERAPASNTSNVRDEDLADLRKELEFWANNCGGCETCGQVFGNKTQPEFSLQELHAIVCELQEVRAKSGLEQKEQSDPRTQS